MDIPERIADTEVPVSIVATHTLDEKVWQSWLTKNRKQEEALYARTIKWAVIVTPCAVAAILYFALSR